ncbi:MAG: hypothetical protein KDK23_05270 [Leptospiraceae bacterium]|nr:hypothetical protein [Leptospiraceae bacterium]
MIQKMKKVNLFLHYSQKKKVLGQLQRLGVIHLNTVSQIDTQKYSNYKRTRSRYQDMIVALADLEKKRQKEKEKHSAEQGADYTAQLASLEKASAREKLLYLEKKFDELQALKAAQQELEDSRAELQAWGDFPVDRLQALQSKGVRIRLFIGSEKAFDQFDFQKLSEGEEAPYYYISVINRSGGKVYFAVLEFSGRSLVIPFEEVALPSRSLNEMSREIQQVQRRLDLVEGEILACHHWTHALEKAIQVLESRMAFEAAKHSLERNSQNAIFYITGFYPDSRASDVEGFLQQHEIACTVAYPEAGDSVPIALKNGFFARMFEPITKLFSLPDYMELDPTPFFAPFFVIFFGMCLGDIGYGLVVSAISAILLFVVPRNWKLLAGLGLTLGLSTTLAGLLLNTFFGENMFSVPGATSSITGQTSDLTLFASYSSEGSTVFPAMTLSLMLGVVQLILGMLLQAVNSFRMNGFMFSIKPAGMILATLGGLILACHTNFLNLGFNESFSIGPLAIGQWLVAIPPVAGQILALGGLGLFFLFNNPDKSLFLRPLTGLWEFYQFITGFLGDFLSYIRLFALGLASGLLGNAFNQIAFMILPGYPENTDFLSPMIAISIIILVIGHTLNLGLSLLGSFVHPLRLTFVEFYKNLDFKGGGVPYEPFLLKQKAHAPGTDLKTR